MARRIRWQTPRSFRTPSNVSSIRSAISSAFPDLQFTLSDVLLADGEAMVRWRGDGSHLGPYGCIPPSGRSFHYEGVTVMRVDERGRITQTWMDTNLKAMLERLKVS
jgi:predicted ester cyclase